MTGGLEDIMKSIIAGRMYNTDTATLVARVENMADVRNFRYKNEELYRKKMGSGFFLGRDTPSANTANPMEIIHTVGGRRLSLIMMMTSKCGWRTTTK